MRDNHKVILCKHVSQQIYIHSNGLSSCLIKAWLQFKNMSLEIEICEEQDEEERGCHISLSGDHRPAPLCHTPQRDLYPK